MEEIEETEDSLSFRTTKENTDYLTTYSNPNTGVVDVLYRDSPLHLWSVNIGNDEQGDSEVFSVKTELDRVVLELTSLKGNKMKMTEITFL